MTMNPSVQASDPQQSDDLRVAELMDELANRLQAGEPVDVEAFLAAHPEHAPRLRRLLPAAQVLAELERSAQAVIPSDGDGPDPAPGLLGDFRIVRPIGRGGMGVVYEAFQVSLGRRVALKVLPLAGALDARQLQRFKNEAQAAAQLQHQNIVPVYFVGQDRGVHYYAMQFIDGQTLAQVIADLRLQIADLARSPGSAVRPAASILQSTICNLQSAIPTAPAAAGPEYFRWVARLAEQAAEALEHAHQLGVVHRDVKPANLMLDARGNLWVTDFGLAHCQNQPGLTQSGDLLGTLRYMSPEQALGRRTIVDHRTDIYSLGVTLYELLTLQPPFAGTDRQELLRQIALDEPRPARRVNAAVPVELETIVLKALEKNPADRYATAQALAKVLRRYLANEPIRARRATWTQAAVKWARRHRALVNACVAALLSAALVSTAALAWFVRDRSARQVLLRSEVETTLVAVARSREDGKWPDAAANARRAEVLLASNWADEPLRADLGKLAADLETVVLLEEIRSGMSDAMGREREDFEDAQLQYAAAFRKLGIDVEALRIDAAGEQIRKRATAVQLAAGLDHWAAIRLIFGRDVAGGTRLLAISRAADPDRFRNQVREALHGWDVRAMIALADSRQALHLPSHTLVLMANVLVWSGRVEPAVGLLTKARWKRPDDFWFNFELGHCFLRTTPPRWEEAVRYYTAAQAIRPRNPSVYLSLGNVLKVTGKLDEAVAALREALRLKDGISYADSECNHLAWLLATAADERLRDPVRALDLARKGAELSRSRGSRFIPNVLGVAYYRVGDWKAAADELKSAVEFHPGAHECFFLAMACWQLGSKDQARIWYNTAVRWMDTHRPRDDELLRLRTEAARLLGIKEKKG
jgi:serine/threonine protein kinase/Flp pilus assembly protein TadD